MEVNLSSIHVCLSVCLTQTDRQTDGQVGKQTESKSKSYESVSWPVSGSDSWSDIGHFFSSVVYCQSVCLSPICIMMFLLYLLLYSPCCSWYLNFVAINVTHRKSLFALISWTPPKR